MIIEKVYNGRNNKIDLLLKADGAAVDLAAVTRMQLVLASTTIDSATAPACFDWAPTPSVTGKVVLSLGGSSLATGDRQTAALIVYDASNPLGINWGSFYLDIST
jgi:hypothetical protein